MDGIAIEAASAAAVAVAPGHRQVSFDLVNALRHRVDIAVDDAGTADGLVGGLGGGGDHGVVSPCLLADAGGRHGDECRLQSIAAPSFSWNQALQRRRSGSSLASRSRIVVGQRPHSITTISWSITEATSNAAHPLVISTGISPPATSSRAVRGREPSGSWTRAR